MGESGEGGLHRQGWGGRGGHERGGKWTLNAFMVLLGWLRQHRAVGTEEHGTGSGVRGVWASDFDADGRCQAFCFPVKVGRG